MALSFLNKIIGFLANPAATFRAVRDEPMKDAAVYYAILLVLTSVLAAVMFYLGFTQFDGSILGVETGPEAGIMSYVWAVLVTYIWGLLTLALWSIVIQIGARGLGARGEFADAFKAATYGQTPALLFGWIPVVGFILAELWSAAVIIIGIRELYKVDTMKAVFVAVIALIVYLVFWFILVSLGIATALGLAGIMGLTG